MKQSALKVEFAEQILWADAGISVNTSVIVITVVIIDHGLLIIVTM